MLVVMQMIVQIHVLKLVVTLVGLAMAGVMVPTTMKVVAMMVVTAVNLPV